MTHRLRTPSPRRNAPRSGSALPSLARLAACACLVLTGALALPASAERVMLLVDNSGSMRQNDATRLVPDAVARFVAALPPETEVGLVSFDARARLLQGLAPAARFSVDALNALDYTGQLTDPSAGVERALYELREAGGMRNGDAVVLITDGVVDLGNPVASARAEEWLLGSLRSDLRGRSISVWGVALTEAADARLLRQLADATGGNYFRADSAAAVAEAMMRISEGIAVRRDARAATVDAVVAAPAARVPEASAAPAPTVPTTGSGSAPAPRPDRTAPATGTARSEAPVTPVPMIRVPAADDGAGTNARWWLALGLLFAGTGMLAWVSYATWRSGREKPADERPALEYFPECYLVDLQGVTDRPTHLLAGKYNMITRLQNPPDDGINYVQVFRRQIGRRHALIEYRDFSFWIIDQNSVNGTFVNGERIHQETRLKHGDRLRFHLYDFEFCVSDLAFSNETLMDRKAAPAH